MYTLLHTEMFMVSRLHIVLFLSSLSLCFWDTSHWANCERHKQIIGGYETKNVHETNEHSIITLYSGSEPDVRLYFMYSHVVCSQLHCTALLRNLWSVALVFYTIPRFYAPLPIVWCTQLLETRCGYSSHGGTVKPLHL